ncbi:sulfur oxidation c-type cytochrome SoxA [Marinibactrum halimedae]|uniref:SoxAX cytochrome complex subunit A n=1 Tax=Marinibactrum halimedae TaxID=1444977 RepID=A0AA37T9R9_9GAMM|nr:sulfur oxidation c-type cytochrome SoxA [Marinibactrum halimedae]MCD9460968.1 sulfur oxidation c-type cytochrome SoxA [Marinibactrum halimedae]GLS28089.1 SoxAX cytochrome complex subunit A [Marinibactrum halimedae]
MNTGYILHSSCWLITYAFILISINTNANETAERTLNERTLNKERSGFYFQSNNTQALQNDSFANPGLLWVDSGQQWFSKRPDNITPACQHCHNQDKKPLVGAATLYPQYDSTTKKLMNIEQRINRCRTQYQHQPPFPYESNELLSLTAYVSNLSKGMPFNVNITDNEKPFFERGRDFFYQRRGQMNLACHHCHEWNAGKKLRGDTLSQGHSNGYPIYRLEWQTLGSLHRRLRFCNTGVRAETYPLGSEEYVNLELFLAWRANQLLIETPAVRR